MKALILVIDDDKKLTRLLGEYLARFEWQILTAHHPDEGLRLLRQRNPDAVVLDIMLPDRDGFETCRQLRAESAVPILMLTARGEVHDRILGLTLGADDYLPKPFEPRELAARLEALMRRGSLPSPTETLAFGDLAIDKRSRSVRLGSKDLALTTAEFDLLFALAQRPGMIWERERLFERIAGGQPGFESRSLDVLLSRLRQKLGDDPRDPTWIRTIRGAGYLFLGKPD